jgi:2-polyprenyl-6-methoxyphenol hydroxylase-like FAD-dependent oxidoreductase
MSERARILIAGAGIGGLALAQSLRHGGLAVAVYERDPTPKTRNQGYRIHIDPNGNAALRTCRRRRSTGFAVPAESTVTWWPRTPVSWSR